MGEFERYILIFIAVVALLAIAYAFLSYANIAIPQVVVYVFWIVVVAVMCAAGVRIIMRMTRQ